MKSKTSLILMEQLMMILIFALAAAICLQLFAGAKAIAEETSRLDQAVILAQNAAEVLKATGGDIVAAEVLSEEGYRLTVHKQESSVSGLGMAEIQVSFSENVLFTLNAGWQEEIS